MESSDLAGIEEFILSRMIRHKIPSVTISLLKNNEVIYSKGFGFRNLEEGAPATTSTIYGIGSITKSFTALSILQLVEKGLIDLYDPVNKYLPIQLKSSNSSVTIHHLLTHSSGIPSLGYAEALIDGFMGKGENWLPISSPEDVLTIAKDASSWSIAPPGKRFFYLNTGYVLLGLIVEKLSGIPYEEYVKRNILEKLKMKRTLFYTGDLLKDPDLACGYVLVKGKFLRKPFPQGISADGGLFSNVMDLSKYLSMFINRSEEVVSEQSLKLMETPYIEVPWKLFGGESYGYGLIIHPNFLGERLIEHSGSVLTYTSFIGYIPERKVGVAVLENSASYPPSHIGMYALAKAIGADPNEGLTFIKKEDIIGKIEGVYESYKGLIKAKVTTVGDFIVVEPVDTEKILLVPEEVTEDHVKCYTYEAGVKIPAEFTIHKQGIELILERYRFVKRL